jgi:hypothetical protein
MSSRLGDGEEALYQRLGADELLRKPLDAAAVLALVSARVKA